MPIGTRLFCSKPPKTNNPLESVLQPTSRGTSAVHSAIVSKPTEVKIVNMSAVTATDAGIIFKRYDLVLSEIIHVLYH
jgi:hypothetical protein